MSVGTVLIEPTPLVPRPTGGDAVHLGADRRAAVRDLEEAVQAVHRSTIRCGADPCDSRPQAE
jgi:hypothetical protein